MPLNPHLSSSAPASGPSNPTTNNPHQPQTQGSAPASSAPLPHLTIIKSDAIQTQVVDVSQEVAGSKPSWSKYVATWKSMLPLLQHCAQAFQQTPPPSASFHLGRTSCSYTSWIQTIISLGEFECALLMQYSVGQLTIFLLLIPSGQISQSFKK